jgi:hypothetical protein
MPPAFDFDSTGKRVAFATAYQQLGILSAPGLEAIGSPFPILTVNFPSPKFGAGDKTLYNNSLAYALEHWDLSGAGLISHYTYEPGPGPVGIAPDSSWLVTQSPDGHWSRWRLPELTLIDRSASSTGEAWAPSGGAQQIAPVVSGDGKYFATAHSDCPRVNQVGCPGSVVIWDSATGRPLGQPIRVSAPQSSTQLSQLSPIGLAFHPDQPLLAIHTFSQVIVVTLEGGSPQVHGTFTPTNTAGTISRWVGFLPSAAAPSPTIVTAFGQTLSVWDVSGGVATRLGIWESNASTRGIGVTPAGEVALLRSNGDLQFIHHQALLSGAEPRPSSVIPNVVPGNVQGVHRVSADGR